MKFKVTHLAKGVKVTMISGEWVVEAKAKTFSEACQKLVKLVNKTIDSVVNETRLD